MKLSRYFNLTTQNGQRFHLDLEMINAYRTSYGHLDVYNDQGQCVFSTLKCEEVDIADFIEALDAWRRWVAAAPPRYFQLDENTRLSLDRVQGAYINPPLSEEDNGILIIQYNNIKMVRLCPSLEEAQKSFDELSAAWIDYENFRSQYVNGPEYFPGEKISC